MMKKIFVILLLVVSSSFALADTPPKNGTSEGISPSAGGDTPSSGPVMVVPILGPLPINTLCEDPGFGFSFDPTLELRNVIISYGGNYHESYFEIDCDNNDLGVRYAELVNRTTGESTGPYRPQAGIVRVPVSRLSGTWVIIVEPATGGYYSGEFRVRSNW